MLPPLRTQGRKGYRRGIARFWQSPNLTTHALTVCQLRALKYPNDEARLALWWMGFPVDAAKVHSAWISRLGKINRNLKSKRDAVINRRGDEFSDPEDEASALVAGLLSELARKFGMGEIVAQIVIDLFRTVFERGFILEIEFISYLSDVMLSQGTISIDDSELLSDLDFSTVMQFIQLTMTFEAVSGIVRASSNFELVGAHRRWRTLLRVVQSIFPEIATKEDRARFVAVGFGRICLPAIAAWLRQGKSRQIDRSLSEIGQFNGKYDLRSILLSAISRNEISADEKKALSELIDRLSKIWGYSGFPFSRA
ncbi:MAG: hypothetical protein WB760_26050 [Xanthobacteraceae bacterium]